MASVIKAGNATDGVQVTSDNTGILELKTGTGAGTTAVTIGTDQSVTFAGAVSSSGNQTVSGNLTVNGNTTLGDANTDTILMTAAPSIGGAGLGMGFGFRNRIINGAMVIDQRNNGASITPTVLYSTYSVDRWNTIYSVGSKFSIQRNAGSVTPPAGFQNYLGVTSLSAYTPATSETFQVLQAIEGFNCADLGWGAAGAATVTLSFWVRSSLTGTFGLAIQNSGVTRSYPVSYTISSANTWEYKTITIPGDTSGTWDKISGNGITVQFSLGAATNLLGTSGAWSGTNYYGVTGQTNIVGTNGATFYITGVQLEKGSTATSFDYRPYTTELQLCQRYYYKLSSDSANAATLMAPGVAYSTTQTAQHLCAFPVTMRSRPTASISGTIVLYVNSLVTTITGIVTQNSSTTQGTLNFQVASGLTAGTYYTVICQNTTGFIDFAAEL